MSLNWNVSKVKNMDEITRNQVQWKITEAILFLTMTIGMSSITKENYKKFATRVRMHENIVGASLRCRREDGTEEDMRITVADIERRIGLYTNASKFTDIQFAKFIARDVELEALAEIRQNEKFHAELIDLFGEPVIEIEPEEEAA